MLLFGHLCLIKQSDTLLLLVNIELLELVHGSCNALFELMLNLSTFLFVSILLILDFLLVFTFHGSPLLSETLDLEHLLLHFQVEITGLLLDTLIEFNLLASLSIIIVGAKLGILGIKILNFVILVHQIVEGDQNFLREAHVTWFLAVFAHLKNTHARTRHRHEQIFKVVESHAANLFLVNEHFIFRLEKTGYWEGTNGTIFEASVQLSLSLAECECRHGIVTSWVYMLLNGVLKEAQICIRSHSINSFAIAHHR
mmetsp:Transcript_6248/g.23502  ORF Transcript_6248/g.23502 Transcript_6248/m.23502 type:complete len:255 (+) Transcript_6248:1318-2082(+)